MIEDYKDIPEKWPSSCGFGASTQEFSAPGVDVESLLPEDEWCDASVLVALKSMPKARRAND